MSTNSTFIKSDIPDHLAKAIDEIKICEIGNSSELKVNYMVFSIDVNF